MGVSIGFRLKAIALFFIVTAALLASLAGTQPLKVEASANLTAYTTVPPNSWEPMGYNVTGTAPYFVTHTLGWDNVKIMGNVGIGDGSIPTLNRSSNKVNNYTDNNFMAADVSMAPLNPARVTDPVGATSVAGATTEASASNNTSAPGNNLTTNGLIRFANNLSSAPTRETNNTTSAGGNEPSSTNPATSEGTTQTTIPAIASDIGSSPLNDGYHSILMGKPVDDMMYEYPWAPTISAYARLDGLPLPGGCCANIGIRCLGYGY